MLLCLGSMFKKIRESVNSWLASPRLTAGLLFYSVALVFVATLAQRQMGVERAASVFFESFFVFEPFGVPLLGGAAVGVLAVVNIVFSSLKYMSFAVAGFGSSIIHSALVLLIVSGALQYFMREEGTMTAAEGVPTSAVVMRNGKTRMLPFSVKLLKFTKTDWQGSDIPKNFSSDVVFVHNNTTTEAVVQMNAPVSFNGWTFYQSSYSLGGAPRSVFTVVKNPARTLPWLASGAVFAGMLFTFASKRFTQKI